MAEAIDGSIFVHTGPEGTTMAVAIQLLSNEVHSRVTSLKGATEPVGAGGESPRSKRHRAERDKSLSA
jgi:hypothetical protein